MNQSELEVNTCSRRQARENACRQVTIGFGFTSDWSISGERFFSKSQSVAMQNQSNCQITFDTQLKTALTEVLNKVGTHVLFGTIRHSTENCSN